MKSSENETGPATELDLRTAAARCRANAAAMSDLRAIYASADRAAAEAGRVCLGGGACCKFDLFGHRLYLTVAELALLTSEPPPGPGTGRQRCPYQVGPDCTARARRPLGCRIFFCRGAEAPSLHDLYERLHRRIRRLHQRHCIPCAYAELCGAILQLHSAK